MRLHLFAFGLVVLLIVQGCTAPTKSTVETPNQESATSITDAVTPPLDPTVYSSATVGPIAEPSIIITNTPLPTAESVLTLQQACFTMLPKLPDTKTYHGKIIFLSEGNYENIQDSHSLASLYNIVTRQTMPMDPEKVKNIKVSPDGSTYAVINTADEDVKFYFSSGQLLRTLPPSEYPYGLDYWLNNEQIALFDVQPWGESYKYPIDLVIYNPFSGEQKQMISDRYPDIDLVESRWMWERVSTTRYDPFMKRVVYPASINKDYLGKSGIGYVLWDLENQVKLAEIVTGDFSVTPIWAPDGSRFVINDSYGNGEFYAVTRDGVVTQLSHMNPESASESAGKRFFSDLYSWSPDGRYLAFWLESSQNSSFHGTLAILNTETGKVTKTCISAGYMGEMTAGILKLSLIWSPDGKALVMQANRQEDGSYQSVLIDPEDEYAAVLTDNKFPVGWLADEWE